MNILGALFFLWFVLAILSTREERQPDTPDLAALECQRLALQEEIAAQRTTLAVFTTLTQDIESQRHVKEIYEREIRELDEEYQQKVMRNAALDQIYGTFSQAGVNEL